MTKAIPSCYLCQLPTVRDYSQRVEEIVTSLGVIEQRPFHRYFVTSSRPRATSYICVCKSRHKHGTLELPLLISFSPACATYCIRGVREFRVSRFFKSTQTGVQFARDSVTRCAPQQFSRRRGAPIVPPANAAQVQLKAILSSAYHALAHARAWFVTGSRRVGKTIHFDPNPRAECQHVRSPGMKPEQMMRNWKVERKLEPTWTGCLARSGSLMRKGIRAD